MFRKLNGRDTFLARCKEVDSDKPLTERKLALAENRPCLNSEISLARGTTKTSVCKAVYLGVLAVRAEIAVSETNTLKVRSARLLVREEAYKVG